MVTVSDEAVEAARQARRDYHDECDQARREESQRVFRHPGAHIPGTEPDQDEGMRRALTAALPHLPAIAAPVGDPADVAELRAEVADMREKLESLSEDESWWVGGAWGDYGEPVIPLRAVWMVLGEDSTLAPDLDSEFITNLRDAREVAEAVESERDAAIAELDRLREGVRALRDNLFEREQFNRESPSQMDDPWWRGHMQAQRDVIRDLRALLDGAPTPSEGES